MIAEIEPAFPARARVQRIALIAGAAALAIAVVAGALTDPTALARAYLLALLFWVGLPLGSLGIALMHRLTGGEWGRPIHGALMSAGATVPWTALALVPVAIALATLYPWARPAAAHDPELAHKALYLNPPFFLVRAGIYVAVWSALAALFRRWSDADARSPDPRRARALRRLSAGGLLAYGFTVSFAAIDWAMSLEPRWYSTVYAGMVGIGWMLEAFAFAILVAAALARRPPIEAAMSEGIRIDLGNLLLTLVVLWAYLSFSQLLIIWSGNIPEEVAWYVRRLRGGWQGIGVFLAAFQFLFPLLALLFRDLKRRRAFAMALGGWLMFTSWVHVFWLVKPAFSPDAFAIHWLDVLVTVGLGGIWIALYLFHLGRGPLVGAMSPARRLQDVVGGATAADGTAAPVEAAR